MLIHCGVTKQPLPLPAAPTLCRLAVTLGMLGVLRQLQPAGRNDYLIARVQLPASMVHKAWQAAEVGLAGRQSRGLGMWRAGGRGRLAARVGRGWGVTSVCIVWQTCWVDVQPRQQTASRLAEPIE